MIAAVSKSVFLPSERKVKSSAHESEVGLDPRDQQPTSQETTTASFFQSAISATIWTTSELVLGIR